MALEFKTDTKDIEFIIFIENQTTNDKSMVFRMIEYITATMLEKFESNQYDVSKGLPRPIPILIYIGNKSCKMPTQMEDYFKMAPISNAGMSFRTHLVNLGGKEYQQILENNSTPSAFLQLMKALYTGDHGGFEEQCSAIKKQLSIKETEVANYYKRMIGLLATDFVDYFTEENNTEKGEVERMATTVREILQLDRIIGDATREGIEQGREIGKEIGRKQAILEMICSFLDLLDDQTIAERTGVPIEEVAKLRKEHQVH